jgi:hypothetical protein
MTAFHSKAWPALEHSEVEKVAPRDALDAVTRTARKRAPAVRVESRLVEGHPGEVLVDASSAARLLVVGSRGLGGFKGACCLARSAPPASNTPAALSSSYAIELHGKRRCELPGAGAASLRILIERRGSPADQGWWSRTRSSPDSARGRDFRPCCQLGAVGSKCRLGCEAREGVPLGTERLTSVSDPQDLIRAIPAEGERLATPGWQRVGAGIGRARDTATYRSELADVTGTAARETGVCHRAEWQRAA